MRVGGNFTKRDHEIFLTKINILVVLNVFTKFMDNENLKLYGTLPRFPIWYHTAENLDQIQVESVGLSHMRALMLKLLM